MWAVSLKRINIHFFLHWANDPKAKVFVQSRNTCKK